MLEFLPPSLCHWDPFRKIFITPVVASLLNTQWFHWPSYSLGLASLLILS